MPQKFAGQDAQIYKIGTRKVILSILQSCQPLASVASGGVLRPNATMRRRLIFMLIAIGLTGTLMLSGLAFGQTGQSDLTKQKVRLHLNRGTLLQALSTLSVEQRVPIGFEPALGHKHEYHLNVDAENISLPAVLDKIVEQEPDYKWEVKDGVINFIPTKSRDGFVEKLLNTRIQRFNPPKILAPSQIRDAIIDLPEVVELLKANNITASHYGYFYRQPSGYTHATVDLRTSNTDVRGVLNKVIRESEHKMWIVSRSGEDLGSLDIGF